MTLRFTVTAREEDLTFLRRIGAGNASEGFRRLIDSARTHEPFEPLSPLDHLRTALFMLEQEARA